jgi:type VI secretion system protein ImpA
MIELFWDELYPHPSEDGEDPIIVRIKPIEDLNGSEGEGTLLEPLRMMLITGSDTPGPFRFWHYQNATGDRPNSDLLEQIKASARSSAVSFYKDLREDLAACAAEYAELTTLLDEKCGEQSPPSSRIRNALDDVRTAVEYLTKDIPSLRAEPQSTDGGQVDETPEAVTSGSGESLPTGGIAAVAAIRSREEAFGALLRIAQFFREAEPHSPLSYTLEELVRRGRLPFIDLLKELVPNAETRRDMLIRAGIAPPPSEDQ